MTAMEPLKLVYIQQWSHLWQTKNEPIVQALVLFTPQTQHLPGYVLINEAAWMEVIEHSKHD